MDNMSGLNGESEEHRADCAWKLLFPVQQFPVFDAFFQQFERMFSTIGLSCGFPTDEGYLPACVLFSASVHTDKAKK